MFHDSFKKDVSLHDGVPKQYWHLRNKVLNDWEIAPWDLQIYGDRKLGEGNWATVYLAKWKETFVAAKVLKQTEKAFLYLREFDAMTKMHHPNIVQLFGYVEEPFIIVMEYFEHQDLKKQNYINKRTKKQISIDILRGLNYFHTRKPEGLIHRDIKLTNIMLTKSKTAKIADFGLSKFIKEQIPNSQASNLDQLDYTNDLTGNVGTERYMAPELIKTDYDYKVDIYSTGILLYELWESKVYNPKQEMYFYWTPKNIKKLIKEMTKINPTERPDAKECLRCLS
jgi:serine/threonine protein kinase